MKTIEINALNIEETINEGDEIIIRGVLVNSVLAGDIAAVAMVSQTGSSESVAPVERLDNNSIKIIAPEPPVGHGMVYLYLVSPTDDRKLLASGSLKP